MPIDVAEHLATISIQTKKARRTLPPGGLDEDEQAMNELGAIATPAAHGIADAHDLANESARQYFSHDFPCTTIFKSDQPTV
jgi:hypothetical protein